MNNLEKEKINVAILPSNQAIKETSRKVKINDVVIISGLLFSHKSVKFNGVEQNLSQCMQKVDLLYADYLRIDNTE